MQDLKENGSKESLLKGNLYLKMELFSMVNGEMISFQVLVLLGLLTGTCMKVSGRRI